MSPEVLSPLGLLLRHGELEDPSATEVVVFTFNHDLGFFERMALAPIQATGARITVVADARMANHDPYDVRRAGTAYLPGLAICSGAFHPKVVVIAGESKATVAVGSGNLTAAGWLANDELWTIHHAEGESGSAIVTQLAAWLRDLPGIVNLSDGLPEALKRSAALLERGTTETTDTSLVHSLHQPIIDQLPRGPVDHLALYAPFHDPNAEAVSALVQRFAPRRVTIAFQPELTRFNGAALAHAVGADAEVVALENDRYRHGKLIEWEREGERWCLTGSPNLSRAALLLSADHGGNVEVGVIAPTPSTLIPDGATLRVLALADLPYTRAVNDRVPTVIILSSVIGADGTTVRLARPLTQPGAVEVSPVGMSPDRWDQALTMSAGDESALITQPLPGGSRVRIHLADGTTSSISFVCDPARLMRTHATHTGGSRAPDPWQLFADPAAAEQFERLVDSFRQSSGPIASKAPTAKVGTSSPTSDGFVRGDWQDYLDRCQGRVGPTNLAFALGLPFMAGDGRSVADFDWDDDVVDDDQVGVEEGETAEDVDGDKTPNTLVAPQLDRATAEVRKRYRSVAERMIRKWREPEPHERLFALRFTLLLVAGGAWPTADDTWPDLLLDGVAGLAIDDPPQEYEEPAGSLAALTLSVVESRLDTTTTTLTHGHFDRVADAVGHLLVAADTARIAEYSKGLEGRFRASTRPELVFDLLERLIANDPIADALNTLAARDTTATSTGRVITLHDSVTDAYSAVCRALPLVADASPVAIRASGPKGWACVVWSAPHLVVIRSGKNRTSMISDIYDYAGASPSADIQLDGRPNSDRVLVQSMAGQPLPTAAADLLHEVGLAASDLVA